MYRNFVLEYLGYGFMNYKLLSIDIISALKMHSTKLSLVLACTLALAPGAYAQDEDFGALSSGVADEAIDFEDEEFDFDQSTEDLENSFRSEAFSQALKILLPLKPDEIRTLLEHFDRTVESTELPVHPYPRPELVVQNVSLDPGVKPLTVKLAFGYVTTLNMLDSSGEPWPIEDISWVGEFSVQESVVREYTHMLRITPESRFAHGNISMRLAGLTAPVIMTFETNRDAVHYRIDAVVPKKGPGASTAIIDSGLALTAGDPDMSVALGGVMPGDAVKLDVSGVDGRTTAFIYNGLTYVRTPLTLLSPGWDSSVKSADGTTVYALEETPVILLSDRGQTVSARLTEREDLLDE